MSSHSFGSRLRFLRHNVEGLPREQLARRLRAWAQGHSTDDASGVLLEVTANEIRAWEKGGREPTAHVKRRIAQVVGYRRELLDPEAPDQELSPERFITAAKRRGLGPIDITHVWKVVTAEGLFKGNRSTSEWERIIEDMVGRLPAGGQNPLFEFWCTHCGFSDVENHMNCPHCGDVD